MAQHDYVVGNGSGAAVRGDSNDLFLAIATMNSGAVAPSVTYSYMPYVNTSDGHLYQRNAANTGWIDHGQVGKSLLRIDGDGSQLSGVVGLPVGVPFYWLADTPPSWALELDGSAVSRATYSDLFAVIGTTYGVGDGSTTFNLPDDRANAIRGWDNGRGVDSGRVFGSEQLDQIQGHYHSISAGGRVSTPDTNTGTAAATGGATWGAVTPVVQGLITDGTNGTPRVGGETRMRNRAYLPCIRY